MATVTLAYDHSRDPMNPDQLSDQIASSLGLASDPVVSITPSQISVTGTGVTAANTAAIQAIVNTYVFDPSWSGGVRGQLIVKAGNALAGNAAFLAIGAPSNAQVLAQVQALTRQVNALIRVDAGLLDSTSGT